MQDCDHRGSRRYARRVFSNGTIHYCVQCSRCLKAVKTDRHDGKLFLKHTEIPENTPIFEWIDASGGLF